MVLDRVLLIVLCSVLLWGGIEGFELTIQRFVYAQIMGLGIVLLVLLVFLFKYFKGVKISFNLVELKPILIKSWPFAILISLMGMYNYIDGVMLKQIIGDEEAGVYAMGYRFYFALLMFAQVFSGVLLPFFSKNIENRAAVNKIANYTFKFLFLIGVSVALILLVYGSDILTWRFPEKANDHGILTFQILMFSFIGSSFILVFGTLLTAALQLRYLNIAALVTVAVNWGLNLLLIPTYGAVGAAIATAVSQLLFGGVCYIICFHKFKFELSLYVLLQQFVVIGLLVVCILLGKQYFENVYVHFTMILIAITITAFFFNLFNAKHLKSLVRK